MSRMIRISIVSVLTAALFAPVTSIAEGRTKSYEKVVARAAAECPDADLDPDAGNLGRIRTAILCLHNQIRAQRGLPLLKENAKLRSAATGHSNDMVSRGFFEHTTPNGVTMVQRIRAARYTSPRFGWALGENLAWGTGEYGAVRSIFQAWMRSPDHRKNILGDYRELGMSVQVGTLDGQTGTRVWTQHFGTQCGEAPVADVAG